MTVANIYEDIYKANSYQNQCAKYANITKNITRIVVVVYGIIAISVASFYILTPLLSTNYQLFAPNILPVTVIDHRTLNGFILTMAFQMGSLLFTAIMVFAYDTLIILLFTNLSMIASIITTDVIDLETQLRDGQISMHDIRRRLIKIIMMHRKYNE